VGDTRLDLGVTSCHRARINVRRLLRADEVATLVSEVLAAIRANEPERAVFGPWGELLLETTSAATIDLLGLGVVAYRLLTGQMPQPNTRYVPGAPPPLAALIVRLLSSDPKQRPSVRDADMAVAVMLGKVTPVDEVLEITDVRDAAAPDLKTDIEDQAFDVVDSFDDDEDDTSSSRPLEIRKPKWTPATHLPRPPSASGLKPLKKFEG